MNNPARTPRRTRVRASSPANTNTRGRRRLTVEIEPGLDDTLEMYCVAFASTKHEVTTKALSVFLNNHRNELIERFKDTVDKVRV
jgi:hypothetical protein